MSALVERRSSELAQARLDELAVTIRLEHSEVRASLERSLRHALAVGHALKEVQEVLGPKGGFVEWVESNCEFSYSTGGYYLRLATYEASLPAGINVSEAYEYVRGFPPVNGRARSIPYPAAVIEEARRRHREGQKYQEIADGIGVPIASVYRWCTRKSYARGAAERAQRQRALVKAAERERRREEVDRLARQKGGSLSKAYSLVRMLGQEIDRARAGEESKEVRSNLSQALYNAHEAERHIGVALGVEHGK